MACGFRSASTCSSDIKRLWARSGQERSAHIDRLPFDRLWTSWMISEMMVGVTMIQFEAFLHVETTPCIFCMLKLQIRLVSCIMRLHNPFCRSGRLCAMDIAFFLPSLLCFSPFVGSRLCRIHACCYWLRVRVLICSSRSFVSVRRASQERSMIHYRS